MIKLYTFSPQLLFGDKAWCICLFKVLEPRATEMGQWEFFLRPRLPLKSTVFITRRKKCFTQSSTGGFVARFLSQVLTILCRILRFVEKTSLGRTTNCPPTAQVVAKDRAVKNAKPANRQAMTKIQILGPNFFENWNFSSFFKEDSTSHKTVVLEGQSLWSISFCNAAETLDWY